MVIDFHTHIFPPEIIRDRERYIGHEKWFGRLYGRPEARMAGIEDLISEMDRCGVDMAVACGFAWSSFDLCVLTNSYIADAAARFPGRVTGFANVPPLHPKAKAELERCASLGLRGVGELMPDSQGFDLADAAALAPVADAAAGLGMPVLVHLSEPVGHAYPGKGTATPGKGYRFAQAFPDLSIVFAHWGGGLPFFELMPEVREALRNVHYDCAASPYLYDRQIYPLALRLTGPEKILFGSDFPLISPERYFREAGEAGVEGADLEALMGANAARMLGVDG